MAKSTVPPAVNHPQPVEAGSTNHPPQPSPGPQPAVKLLDHPAAVNDFTDNPPEPVLDDEQYEAGRSRIWRTLTEALRPLPQPHRAGLAMAILSELLDEPGVRAEVAIGCIERAEAALYLHRFPPEGDQS